MSNQRSRIIKKIAYDLSLDYKAEATQQLLPFLEDFELFRRGRRRRLLHVMEEVHPMMDYKLQIFDYKYYRGRSNHRRVFYQTVFFIRSKKLGLPAFHMRPESILHNLGEWLRLRSDIDFSDFPKFSKQYELQGADEDYIRATMNEEVLSFFTEQKNWHLEGVNYYLILYKKNRLISAQDMKEFLRVGLYLAKILEVKDLGLSYE
ncbi:MAG TPA: hypothetical protein VJ953_00875 [Saprospiraceae bacterium]|nr:hypothetical protein [Saprospiraceae bacterium]